MPRPSRIRRIAKWSGVVVCVLLVVVWVYSLSRLAVIGVSGKLLVVGGGGIIAIRQNDSAPDRERLWWETESLPWHMPSWRINVVSGISPWGPQTEVHISLWLPFVLIALPTAYLFWRDRRYPPGHCQECGYDLTGNESGVCPECGKTA